MVLVWPDRPPCGDCPLALALRLFLTAIHAFWPQLPPRPFPESSPKRPAKRRSLCRLLRRIHRADRLLAASLGLALCCAAGLALLLRATPQSAAQGLGLRLGRAGLCAALILNRVPMLKWPFARDLARAWRMGLGTMLAFGALAYPDLIHIRAAAATAKHTADNPKAAPFCLRACRAPAQPAHLMVLTLPLAPFGLILTVEDPAGPRHYRWSYRALDFIPKDRILAPAACPRRRAPLERQTNSPIPTALNIPGGELGAAQEGGEAPL